MFRIIKSLKDFQNKYLIPVILGLIGLIIAWYNYHFESLKDNNQFMIYMSYAFFVVYPIFTPLLARLIIAYQSIIVGIIFALILFASITIETLNLLIDLN